MSKYHEIFSSNYNTHLFSTIYILSVNDMTYITVYLNFS